jgi:hypothetical protein
MNEDDLDGVAFGLQERDEKCVQNSGQETWKVDAAWEVGIRVYLKDINCELDAFDGAKFPLLRSRVLMLIQKTFCEMGQVSIAVFTQYIFVLGY